MHELASVLALAHTSLRVAKSHLVALRSRSDAAPN